MRDLRINGSIILRRFLEEFVCEGVYWIRQVEYKVRWWPFVNTVINLRVP
jgi:hypothetical protein